MIQRIDPVNEILATSIPYTLTLKDNDVLVIEVDQEKFDFDEAHSLVTALSASFPKNKIICTFKGIEIKGVIQENENKECD